MGYGEDVYSFGSPVEKHLRAFVHRRSRRIDIVNQKNPSLFDLFFLPKDKCPSDSAFSLGPA